MGYAFGIKQHTSFSLRNQPFTVPLPSIGRVCLEKSVRVSSTPNLAVLKNPGILAEQAGGVATDGVEPVLKKQPQSMHERTPLVVGSKNEVDRFLQF